MTGVSEPLESGTDPDLFDCRVLSDLDPDLDSGDAAQIVAHAVAEVLKYRGIGGGARVRLSTPTADGSVLIQVNLRVRDKPVRMQTLNEGLDDWAPAMRRLDRQIVRSWGPWQPRPWPDPTRIILTAPERATIVRRKTVPLARTTPWCAAEVLDAMDYNVHLFADVETGEEAVVFRAGPTGLRLARQHRVCLPSEPGPDPLVVNSRPVRTLTEDAALARLRAHSMRFIFFTDADTGRGKLLYPRYDGGIGLIAPA